MHLRRYNGKWLLLLPLLSVLLLSCNKDDDKLSSGGKITLSSETFGSPYYVMGYSFETQGFYKRLSSGNDVDIYLNEIIKPSGALFGVQFATNSLSESAHGFSLTSAFSDAASAEAFYNAYTRAETGEGGFVTLTDTVRLYQVYTCKTWKDHYVKFLVRDIRPVEKDGIADHMEVDIEYFIQRDGSDKLTE